MKLKRKNLWIRWAYLPETLVKGHRIPDRSDLCSIFWRGVLLTPAFLLVCALTSPALAIAWVITELCNWIDTMGNGGNVGKLSEFLNSPIEDTVPFQWLKAKKQGICPIVEIED